MKFRIMMEFKLEWFFKEKWQKEMMMSAQKQ